MLYEVITDRPGNLIDLYNKTLASLLPRRRIDLELDTTDPDEFIRTVKLV